MSYLLNLLWGLENNSTFAALLTTTTFMLLCLFVTMFILQVWRNASWFERNKKTALFLGFIFVLSLFLRAEMFDLHFPNDGGDFFYVAAARNIAEYGRFQTCDYADYCLPPKKPYLTYPLITGIVFAATGPSVDVAAWVNIMFSSLSVMAIYFATKQMFKNDKTAVISTVLLALMIQHIFYANTPSSHATSVFFLIVSVFAFSRFFEKKDLPSHLFALSALGLAISCRLDHWLLLFFFGFWYVIKLKEIKGIRPKIMLVPITLFVAFMLPISLMVYPFAFHDNSDASDFGLVYAGNSMDVLGSTMLSPDFIWVWFLHFAGFIGAVFLLKKRDVLGASLVIPAVVFLVMFILYEYSSVTNMRYLLPGSILCIIVTSHVFAVVARAKSRIAWFPFIFLAIFFIGPFFADSASFYTVDTYPLFDFTIQNRAFLEECALVQCESRVSWAVLDTNIYPLSWDIEIAKNPEHLRNLVNERCVRYVETTRCFEEHGNPQELMKNNFNLHLLKEANYEEDGETIRLYEIKM